MVVGGEVRKVILLTSDKAFIPMGAGFSPHDKVKQVYNVFLL